MSYTPTLEDTMAIEGEDNPSPQIAASSNKGGTYQPTLDDTLQFDQSDNLGDQGNKNQVSDLLSKMNSDQSSSPAPKSFLSKSADFLGIPGYARQDLKNTGGFAALMGTSEIPGAAGIISRLGVGGGLGALENPDNKAQGALTGAGFSAAGEAVPAAFSGIGKIAELINPVKYAGKLGKQIQNTYQTFKDQASNIYNDLRARHGDSNIYQIGNKLPSTNYLKSDPENMSYLTSNSDLRKMHNTFIKDPSFENAHKLQSQMGTEIREIRSRGMDASSRNTVSALSDLRTNLLDDMGTFLNNTNKLDYAQYQTARGITRDIVAPHDIDSYVGKVARGKIKNTQPEQLVKGIKNAVESGELPKGHYLEQLGEQLNHRMQRGQAINDLGSLIGGGAIGEMLMPGGYGLAGGLGIGSAVAKYVNPTAIKLAQNPYFLKGLQNLGKGYNVGRGYLLNEKLNNQ